MPFIFFDNIIEKTSSSELVIYYAIDKSLIWVTCCACKPLVVSIKLNSTKSP